MPNRIVDILNYINVGDIIYTLIIALPFYLSGGIDRAFTALLIFMLFDYITGIIKGIKFGTLNSKTGSKGILKKILMLVVVAMAVQLDYVFSWTETTINVRFVIITFYLGNEGLSILENLTLLDIPVPTKIKKILQQCKDENIKK